MPGAQSSSFRTNSVRILEHSFRLLVDATAELLAIASRSTPSFLAIEDVSLFHHP